MKRNLIFILVAVFSLLISSTDLNAQENKEKETKKKVEKRIKIVKVDESGEKTVIDTTITGDSDIDELQPGEGMIWIMESEDDLDAHKTEEGKFIIVTGDGEESFSFYSKGDKLSGKKGGIYMIKEGDMDSFSFVTVDDESKQLEEGQVHITIQTNNDVEDLIIDGDAVITIKDGKVKVDSEGLKTNINKDVDSKVKNKK
jgi:hypothetical protein